MKVKNLLFDLNMCLKRYGDDFLEWDIALEQHPEYKECCNCNKQEDSILFHNNYEYDTLYIKSHAGECVAVEFTKDKIYGINIHY